MRIIYRALPFNTQPIFRVGDYVTPRERFALDHAETSSLYNGEDYAVIKAYVQDTDIKPADNPGEYRMTKDVPGKVIWKLVLNKEYQTVDHLRVGNRLQESILKKFIEASSKYHFVGTCVNSFDSDGDCLIPYFNDTSDFAVQEEESKPITKEQFVKNVDDFSMVPVNSQFLITPNKNVIMAYDPKLDVHYFFGK
jgi:hypothetical protein